MLSIEIERLQQSKLVLHPCTTRIDSIAWIKFEMLRQNARALERALAAKTPSGVKVQPIMAAKPTPINPGWAEALAVFGD